MTDIPDPALSRRHLLVAGGMGALAAGLWPLAARAAAEAEAATADLQQRQLIGAIVPKTGKVTLKVPQIAENGNTVPFTVTVDSPMTATDRVKAIHVLAEANPAPGIASFAFGPLAGKAEITMRMRLAKTQSVRAIAVMSDGSVYMDRQEVKVTIGGCGG